MLEPRLYTLPNLLTLIRPVCTGPFVLLCAQVQKSAAPWACGGVLLLYLLIITSDLLDGWYARKLGQESLFGRTLDHVCDVLFILTALGFFVILDLVPWWLPAAIAWAFVLYVLDSWWHTAGQPRHALVASRLGRIGGILYYVAVGLVAGNLCTGNTLFSAGFLRGCFIGLALLALMSGTERLYHGLRLWCHLPPEEPAVEKPSQSNGSAP